jgi:hypothetical protein
MTNQTLSTMSKSLALAGAVTLGLLAAPAQAQIQITISPPAAFIATSRPVYYAGRATYWYGGRWYYREGRSWQAYRDEPRYLRESRVVVVPSRKHYEKRRHHRRGNR